MVLVENQICISLSAYVQVLRQQLRLQIEIGIGIGREALGLGVNNPAIWLHLIKVNSEQVWKIEVCAISWQCQSKASGTCRRMWQTGRRVSCPLW